MKIYFDSNLWIDYLWGKNKGQTIRKTTDNLIETIKKKKHRVVTSIFLYSEISHHFRDWFILKEIIKKGFSYRELGNLKKQKKHNKITEKQREEIIGYLDSINEMVWVDAVELENLDKNALDIFSRLTLAYDIDFADACHMIIAMNEECRFLITEDDDMREKGNSFLADYSLLNKFKIINKKEFLSTH